MPFSPADLVTALAASNGLLRPSHYELTIPQLPQWAQGVITQDQIRLFCNSTQLPGVNVDSVNVRKYGTGFMEFYPTTLSFADLQTTFYCDAQGDIINFFNQWIANIVNLDPDADPTQRYRVQYRDQYISQVCVTQYDSNGNEVIQYTYVDAFPVQIQPIGVRWFSRDEMTEVAVVWKYRTWTSKDLATNSSLPSSIAQPIQTTGLPGIPIASVQGS